MNGTVREGIFGTFVLIGLFLILTNAGDFATILRSFTEFYTKSVGALQART